MVSRLFRGLLGFLQRFQFLVFRRVWPTRWVVQMLTYLIVLLRRGACCWATATDEEGRSGTKAPSTPRSVRRVMQPPHLRIALFNFPASPGRSIGARPSWAGINQSPRLSSSLGTGTKEKQAKIESPIR